VYGGHGGMGVRGGMGMRVWGGMGVWGSGPAQQRKIPLVAEVWDRHIGN
jgi:hypothetical protein